MRKLFSLLLLLSITLTAQAQSSALAAFNIHQETVLRTGMLILGGWAIVNILVASFKLSTTTRARRYFHQMNLYWNIVNLLIAGIALHQIISVDSETATLAESLRQHLRYKKILYLNVGLDVAYLAFGAYLRQRSKTATFREEQLMGWGQSVSFQGFFLFVLDVVLVILLEYKAEQLFGLIS